MEAARPRHIMLLVLFVLVLLTHDAEGWWWRRTPRRPKPTPKPSVPAHDIRTQSGLTRLYNSRVISAEKYKRPLGGGSYILGPFSHSGVVVTVTGGSRWLIHKGDGFGVSGQTVVTDVRHMSSRWRGGYGSKRIYWSRVTDYVRVGGSKYNWVFKNCHDASNKMMSLR